jgi:hypothetical protein
VASGRLNNGVAFNLLFAEVDLDLVQVQIEFD